MPLPASSSLEAPCNLAATYLSSSCCAPFMPKFGTFRDQLQGFLEFPLRDLRVLQGLSATEVYMRQARNLLNIYR